MSNKFIRNMNVIGVIVFVKLNFLLRTMKISRSRHPPLFAWVLMAATSIFG